MEKQRFFLAVEPPLLRSLLSQHFRMDAPALEVVGELSSETAFSFLLDQVVETQAEVLVHSWRTTLPNLYRYFIERCPGLRIIHLCNVTGTATLFPGGVQSKDDTLAILMSQLERTAASVAADREN